MTNADIKAVVAKYGKKLRGFYFDGGNRLIFTKETPAEKLVFDTVGSNDIFGVQNVDGITFEPFVVWHLTDSVFGFITTEHDNGHVNPINM